MKTSMFKTLFATATALALVSSAANAQTVIVESRTGTGTLTANPPYQEVSGNWANSTAKSSASPLSGSTTQGSRFATSASSTFNVKPTLATAGGIYSVDISQASSTSIPTDLSVNISVTGGTGLPASTTVFAEAGANTWEAIGTLTLNGGVTVPTVQFTKNTGSGTGQRFYSDAVRFIFQGMPAAARTWNGGGADNNWSTAANWGGTAPALSGDAVVFAGSTRLTPSMNNSYSVTYLSFSAGAGAFTISRPGSETLTVSSSAGITNLSSSLQTLNVPVALTGTGGRIETVGTSGNITINGVVSGSQGLTKVGTGTLTLGGTTANTYSGTTALNAGTVAMNKTAGQNAITGTTLSVGTGAILRNEANNQIPDAMKMTLSGTGIYDVNGKLETLETIETSSGNPGTEVKLGAGTLTVKPSSAVSYNLATGISGNYAKVSGTAGSKLVVDGTGQYRLHNATNSFEKLEVKGGGLFQAGNFSGNNFETIFGAVPASFLADAITLNNGRIGASFVTTLHANRGITLGAGGGTVEGSLTIDGAIAGVGSLTKTGSGSVILKGDNSYSGGTIISANTVQIRADSGLGAVPGALDTDNISLGGGILEMTNSFTLNANRGLTMTAASTLSVLANSTVTYNSVVNGAFKLTKAGTGKLVLGGENFHSGGTTISGGTLGITLAEAIGSGQLDLASSTGQLLNETASLMTLNNSVKFTAATVFVGGNGDFASPGDV